MNLEQMDGRKVIKFSYHVKAYGDIVYRELKFHEVARLSYEYYGDHGENWIIIEKVGTGEEIERYNTKDLFYIEWGEMPKPPKEDIPF